LLGCVSTRVWNRLGILLLPAMSTTGEAKAEVLKLTGETGELLERSILKAAATLETFADRCQKVSEQIKQHLAGESIKDRIVSLHDPDARPIRKGKLGRPPEFGFVSQLAEATENTKPGARGLILPAATGLGNPAEETLLPGTVAELERLGIAGREVTVDGGFKPGPTNTALAPLAPEQRVAIASVNLRAVRRALATKPRTARPRPRRNSKPRRRVGDNSSAKTSAAQSPSRPRGWNCRPWW
jgi:hypothetical protein